MKFIEEIETCLELWGDGSLRESIFTSDRDELFEFAETLALIVKHHSREDTKKNENFSFVANSSLSGGPFPCSHINCRTQKLDKMTSFASLYADEVYIQNPFENIVLAGKERLNEMRRHELVNGIHNFFYLQPLIEKGIVKYSQNMISLCSHHWQTLGEPLSKKIEEKEQKLYEYLHEYLIEHCTVTFDAQNEHEPFFEFRGPESFIDHGAVYHYLFEPYSPYVRNLITKRLPYKLSQHEIREENLLSSIIGPIVGDMSNLEWHSAFFGTSYLCDNPTQLKIASKLNPPTFKACSNSFEKAFSHYLPTIHSKDLSEVMKLREQEHEAFCVYRDKINSIIRGSGNWSETEVEECFRDQVLPEINLIDKKIKDWKSKTKSSLKEKLIFGSGAVSVGLYAGLLPPNIGQIIAAIGGGTAVTSALMEYNKTLKEKDEARSNDYYFLWQAKK